MSKSSHLIDRSTFGQANVAYVIPGSEDYRKFTIHMIGGTVGQAITIHASMIDLSTTFAEIYDPTETCVAGAAGVIFHFELSTNVAGGVMVKATNNGPGVAGALHIRMEGNVSSLKSSTGS
mgnify:CR=1 FL=1